MKLNSKVRYGLRTLIEIAANPKGIMQKDIAVRQKISAKYLDQIIAGLKAADLIIRGTARTSGYRLIKNTDDIKVYDVYKAFEHELNISRCDAERDLCVLSDKCQTKNYWCELNHVIKTHMKQYTLADLIRKYIEKEKENTISK